MKATRRRACVVLAILSCVAGCGRVWYDPLQVAFEGTDAGDDPGVACELPPGPDLGPPPSTPFSAPAPIAELNSSASEDDPTLTADLLEIYFQSDRSGAPQLWSSRRSLPTDPWDPPALVSELASYRANTPFISRDGLTLYFASPRMPGGAETIFVTTRETRADAWGAPTVVEAWSSGDGETGARTFLEEHGAVFFSRRPGGSGGGDLWLTMRHGAGCEAWGAAFPVPGEVNTTNSEANPWIREDGLVIVYQGSGSLGNGDLLYAIRPDRDSDFGAPGELSELSSNGVDDDPWMNDTMTLVVFASARSGNVELYSATR